MFCISFAFCPERFEPVRNFLVYNISFLFSDLTRIFPNLPQINFQYARDGNAKHIRTVLDSCKTWAEQRALLEETDENKYKPLHHAARAHHLDAMRVLIEKNASGLFVVGLGDGGGGGGSALLEETRVAVHHAARAHTP